MWEASQSYIVATEQELIRSFRPQGWKNKIQNFGLLSASLKFFQEVSVKKQLHAVYTLMAE